MKTPVLAVALALGLSGFALGAEDESAFKIDLRGANPGAPVYYLKCATGSNELTNGCGLVSVWQEINDLTGLQAHSGLENNPIDKRILA